MAVLCAVWWHYAQLPLWPTDLWDHVNYGRWMLQHRQLPAIEPLVPLVTDQPMSHTAWLAQVIMALVMRPDGGPLLMQWLHAVLIALAAALPAWAADRRTTAYGGMLAVFIFVAMGWHQNQVVRPQTAGIFFYCLLVARLVRSPTVASRRSLTMLAVMFAVWANLHGSFAIGLTLIALSGGGRLLDLAARRKSLAGLWKSRAARITLQRLIAGVLGSLINPHGLWIYSAVLSVGRHPNIRSMFEWQPLSATSDQARILVGVAVVTAVGLRFSGRRLRLTLLLPMLFFFALTVWSSRMINWLGPLAAVAAAQHLSSALSRTGLRQRPTVRQSPGRRRYSGLAILLLLAVVLQQVQRWPQRSFDDALAAFTPVQAAERLQDLRPRGLCFAPVEWAGFFQNQVDDFQPMVNLHVHLMPRRLWTDYLQLAFGETRQQILLRRYDFDCVITDRRRNGRLIDLLRSSGNWQQVYVDQQVRIFRPVGR